MSMVNAGDQLRTVLRLRGRAPNVYAVLLRKCRADGTVSIGASEFAEYHTSALAYYRALRRIEAADLANVVKTPGKPTQLSGLAVELVANGGFIDMPERVFRQANRGGGGCFKTFLLAWEQCKQAGLTKVTLNPEYYWDFGLTAKSVTYSLARLRQLRLVQTWPKRHRVVVEVLAGLSAWQPGKGPTDGP